MPRPVTCTMSVSLDGYVVGPDGDLSWGAPDDELFAFMTEEFRAVGTYVLGRRLYETMRYWETAEEDPELDDAKRTWARLWNPLPKVVFSSTLDGVDPSARLATEDLGRELARLREEPTDAEIAIGGATLAAQAAELGLIDEYRVRISPVLLGHGTPYFAHDGRRTDLELVASRTYSSAVYLRYRVLNGR